MEGLVLKLGALVTALIAMLSPLSSSDYGYKIELIDYQGGSIEVEIADTPEKQRLGLSGREELEQGKGMLFVYPFEDERSFWMKDMNFSIDIIWIDKDFKITHIESSMSPETFPKSFSARAQYVLELPAEDTERRGFQVGSQLDLKTAFE